MYYGYSSLLPYFICLRLLRFSVGSNNTVGAAGKEAEEVIERECAANEVFAGDRPELLRHCAVLAEVVVVKRAMTMFVARGILAVLAGDGKFMVGLSEQLDDLVYNHASFVARETV